MSLPVIEVPDRLKKFPLWLGRYPVRFTVFVRPDGTPSFKDVNRNRQVEAAHKNLCHLCGERLDARPYWFIVFKADVESHCCRDGPMHEDCARYAVAACPFLANPDYAGKRTVGDLTNAGAKAVLLATGRKEDTPLGVRPDRIALATADLYVADTKGQFPLFSVARWLSVDWDAIPSRSGVRALGEAGSRAVAGTLVNEGPATRALVEGDYDG